MLSFSLNRHTSWPFSMILSLLLLHTFDPCHCGCFVLKTRGLTRSIPNGWPRLTFCLFVCFSVRTNTGWVILQRKLWHFIETARGKLKYEISQQATQFIAHIHFKEQDELSWTVPSVKTWELCCWLSSGTGPERLTHIHTHSSDITSWWLNHWTHRCVLLYVCLSTSVCVCVFWCPPTHDESPSSQHGAQQHPLQNIYGCVCYCSTPTHTHTLFLCWGHCTDFNPRRFTVA